MRKSPLVLHGLLFAVFLLSTGTPASANQDKSAPNVAPNSSANSAAWTPEDMVFYDLADQVRVSPDGKSALWVRTVPDRKRDSRAQMLFLSSLSDREELQLTREMADVGQPRWSPDGKLIAFLSHRALPEGGDGQPHIWLINPAGGEPWPALTTDARIKHFEWQDNDHLIFSAAEDSSLFATQVEEKKDNTKVVDDDAHTSPVRLFLFTLKTKAILRLTRNIGWIDNFEISPDGKSAVVSEGHEQSYQWDRKVPPSIAIVDLSNGSERRIFTEDQLHPRVVKWAADNSGVYAIVPRSNVMPEPSGFARQVYFYEISSSSVTQVNLEWEKGISFLQRFEVTPDGFIALLADGVRFKPARYVRNGRSWSHKYLQGQHEQNYFNIALSPDARVIVYEYSTASIPWQWYRAELVGTDVKNPALLIDVYANSRHKTTAKTEVIHWKGANEDEVDGILYYPSAYSSGKKYPLVTYTHGGPMGADMDAWSANPAYVANLLTQRGAFVLETNYHGSANYGAKWAEAICCGKYYDLEIPDIEKGVDHLISEGLVDPDKIGAFGWSNGAILSIQLNVTNPGRYKATVVGAGDVEYVSDWGNSEFGDAFDNFYFGKTPIEDTALYIRKSPVYKLDRVRTPTLIMHGNIDQNVPTSQGWLHYRTLYYLQNAPVRFLLFPGEEHFPMKLSHQLRVTNEELAWFDKYLFKTVEPENEALKEDSLLSLALKHAPQKVGSRYGVPVANRERPKNREASALIPETVHHGDLQVGRFEVTRAQFAAFDKSYKLAPGTENYPANGVSFEQASAYCVWLSKLTGTTYRLPRQDEAAQLYAPHGKENTLDHWAGYSVNPDDAERLSALLDKISPDSLLREVGSFSPTTNAGEVPIFDLDGNVAEWTQAADGHGRAMGGSADQPSDSKASAKTSRSQFIGFRVVSTSVAVP